MQYLPPVTVTDTVYILTKLQRFKIRSIFSILQQQANSAARLKILCSAENCGLY